MGMPNSEQSRQMGQYFGCGRRPAQPVVQSISSSCGLRAARPGNGDAGARRPALLRPYCAVGRNAKNREADPGTGGALDQVKVVFNSCLKKTAS
jgi:hypothetical protein